MKKTKRLKKERKRKGLRTYTLKHKTPQLDFDRFPQSIYSQSDTKVISMLET